MLSLPYIFTFFSYKGGVGRSMALLNVAHALVARGRNVLMLEMDLEAPGVASFLRRTDELGDTKENDIVDLLAWAKEFCLSKNGLQITSDMVHREQPDLHEFIEEVRPEKLQVPSLTPGVGNPGKLHLIGARISDEFVARLHALALHSLDQVALAQISEVVRIIVKGARIAVEQPSYYGSRENSSVPYDYVLVDARTGFTELGGLCVGPLADRVIVFTGLNDQNVQGTLAFKDIVGLEPVDNPAAYFFEQAVKLEQHPSTGKPSLFVGSPVPYNDPDFRKIRLAQLKASGLQIASMLSYHPRMALIETNFVRDYSEEYLAKEYLALTDRLMEFVGDDVEHLTKSVVYQLNSLAHVSAHEGRIGLAPTGGIPFLMMPTPIFDMSQAIPSPSYSSAAWQALRIAATDFGRASFPLTQLLNMPWAERSIDDLFAADQIFRRLEKYGISRQAEFYAQWTEALKRIAIEGKPEFRIELLREARARIALGMELNRGSANLFGLLGEVLALEAHTRTGPEEDKLIEEASAALERSVQIEPTGQRLKNWAHVLRDLANSKTGSQADSLFDQSVAKYQEALSLSKDEEAKGSIWWCMAITLNWKAKNKSGTEKSRLLLHANECYLQASELSPRNIEILVGWAKLLVDLSKAGSASDARARLLTARSTLEKALAIRQEYPEAKQELARIDEILQTAWQ